MGVFRTFTGQRNTVNAANESGKSAGIQGKPSADPSTANTAYTNWKAKVYDSSCLHALGGQAKNRTAKLRGKYNLYWMMKWKKALKMNTTTTPVRAYGHTYGDRQGPSTDFGSGTRKFPIS